MISFIVIGKNEGPKLTNCLNSIKKAIELNEIISYEIIYVDSNSTDDSLIRARLFSDVNCYKIHGACNAAIGRNIGAKVSKGDVLFFIDGDMEILHNFLPLVYDPYNGLKYNFVSGNAINYNYNYNGTIVSKTKTKFTDKCDKFEITTGGIFLITRTLWMNAGGMKSKFTYNEDLDLGIRLALTQNKLLRKKEIIAIHHTVPYKNTQRMWKMLFSKAEFFRAVLLRDNFFNINMWKYFLRGNYTLVLLLLLLILSVKFHVFLIILCYFPLLSLRTILQKDFTISLIISRVFYMSIYEPCLVFSFFLFWPKSHKEEFILVR